MSTAEVVEQLKHLSNPDRLVVIEAATRLIRENLSAQTINAEEDPVLKVAGCLSGNPLTAAEIEQELYGENRS